MLTQPSPIKIFGDTLSVSGRIWQDAAADERIIQALAQQHQISPLIATILANRHIGLDQAASFLNPTLKQLLPDPFHLKDMEIAVSRVIQALQDQEKIAIFADYDVDGATSSAIVRRYLHACGVSTTLYVPDRIEEGYGPNSAALAHLKSTGHQLVIMLDCGTTAFEPVAHAREIALDLIIVDHHTAEAQLPQAFALINPNRLDESSSLTHLCTAGLAFLFIVGLHNRLRACNWFENRSEPDVRQYLDLAALGTVCDVMPLTGLNRAFVAQGLKVMAMRGNIGLAALADISSLNERPTAYHLGFVLGPRVNAGGRVGQSDLGGTLLATQDPIEARAIAQKLHQHNQERQAIEAEVLQQAFDQVDRQGLADDPVLIVHDPRWHPGVIGIVASRLKERFQRPACVVSFRGEIGKGSGRSVYGLHLGQAMHQAVQAGLLIYGGGHAMAAGFTLHQDSLAAFRQFLKDTFATHQYQPTLVLDGLLSPQGCTVVLAGQLQCLEPFGSGNASPRFAVRHVRCQYVESFGNEHLRVTFIGEDGSRLKSVAFRAASTDLGKFLLSRPSQHLHIAGTLKQDNWNGRQDISFILEDVMVCTD